jgi:hypothetical protein
MEFKKTEPIWHKFVECMLKRIYDGGYLVAIHPSGWRNVSGKFYETKNLLLSKKMHFLSIHGIKDGKRIFGCETRYDWYVLGNTDCKEYITEVDCENKEVIKKDLKKLPFIPNYDFDKVLSMLADDGEERVNIKHMVFQYQYHARSNKVNKTPTDQHIYPCIEHVGVSGEPTCVWYANEKPGEHFDTPKVIFSCRLSRGVMIDGDGKFGCCTGCSSIIAQKDELHQIKEAMESKGFLDIMKPCDIGGKNNQYPYKIIALLRKDFWKEFIKKNDRVEVLHSPSAYQSRAKHISKTKSDIFKYPIIYSTNQSGPVIMYSSVNNRGHFGIPKVITNRKSPCSFFSDFNGEYGMSQYCVGIVGDRKYLNMVAKVIAERNYNGFKEFLKSFYTNDNLFNNNVIALLRKDFWKEFIKDEAL